MQSPQRKNKLHYSASFIYFNLSFFIRSNECATDWLKETEEWPTILSYSTRNKVRIEMFGN
jgi:hypothetical protein